MQDKKHSAIQIFMLTTSLVMATADSGCNDSITELNDYGSKSPFLYCFKDGRFSWSHSSFNMNGNICTDQYGDTVRVKLKDIDIFIYKSGYRTTPCSLSRRYYKKQKSGRCIPELVKPFLETFSGKTPSPDQVKQPPLKASAGQGRDQAEMISYQFDCVVEDVNTVDICQHNKSLFEGTSTIKLLFNQESLGKSSGCYCSVVTDDIYSIKAKALDIRLNAGNKLLFDSYQLPAKEFYWEKDDVIRTGFSKIRLLNLGSEKPSSVWMSVSGVNFSVTCDNKPLDIPGGKDSHSSSSSAGGFNTMYIIAIVVGCVVLLILMFLMARCLKKDKHKHDDIDMEDYEVAEPISDKSSQNPEEEILISSQLDVEYAKPMKRLGRKSEEKELYDRPNVYKPMQDANNENEVSNNNENSNVSSSIDQSSSKQNLSVDEAASTGPNIYSHLGEKPDIVPSSSSDLYDTTAQDGYSVLERHPKTVATDNLYDIA